MGAIPSNMIPNPVTEVQKTNPAAVPENAAQVAKIVSADRQAIEKNLVLALRKAGYDLQVNGRVKVRDSAAIAESRATEKAQATAAALRPHLAALSPLTPPLPPPVVMTNETKASAKTFAVNLDKGMSNFLAQGVDTTGKIIPWPVSKLTSDMLLSAFLKLQITDPNNDVRTHDDLSTAMSALRQKALEDAWQKEKEALKELEEARKKAEEAANYASATSYLSIIALVLAAIMAIFTMGASAAMVAMSMVMKIAMAVVVMAAQIHTAQLQKAAADKQIQAEEKMLSAERFRRLAEIYQEMLQSETAIIKVIIESKNKTYEAVMQMLNAMFASNLKLQSAAMA